MRRDDFDGLFTAFGDVRPSNLKPGLSIDAQLQLAEISAEIDILDQVRVRVRVRVRVSPGLGLGLGLRCPGLGLGFCAG